MIRRPVLQSIETEITGLAVLNEIGGQIGICKFTNGSSLAGESEVICAMAGGDGISPARGAKGKQVSRQFHDCLDASHFLFQSFCVHLRSPLTAQS